MHPLLKCAASFACAAAASLLLTRGAHADDIRTLPTMEAGLQFISGVGESSLTGSRAYILQFRSESVRGTFRPSVAAEFMYSKGSTSVTSSATTYTLYGGSFNAGYNVFLFKEGFFQPSFGLGAVVGWHYFQMATPPAAVEAYTQGYTYGYELSSGVDIRFSRSDASAVRLKASMVYLKSKIAGLTGFGLGGFRLMAGFVY